MDIAGLQRLTARTWPGLEQGSLGAWELRAAGGFTGRANSALPVGDPGLPLTDAVEAVRRWYADRGLPGRLQVPEATRPGDPDPAPGVADHCARSGWTTEPWTAVMTREVRGRRGVRDTLTLAWAEAPDADWLSFYHYRGAELPAGALAVLQAAPAWYLTVSLDGEPVGVGRVAPVEDWVVLTAIEVLPEHRGRGFGADITEALAEQGARHGARHVALQVFEHNPAVALYAHLGYETHHHYRYWVSG